MCSIYYALKNIAALLNEMRQTNVTGVWKNLCPPFTYSFKNLEDLVGNVT
jgi:hypothetical protein